MAGTDTDLLRSVGLRVTATRLAVLAAIDRRAHASADDIVRDIQTRLPSTSPQAVYGVLAALTGVGLLRRIEPAGSPARYERRTGDNHHHVVCSLCGVIADVDCAVEAAPCMLPPTSAGFTITTAEVTYWGLCPECTAAETTAAASTAATPAASTAATAATAATAHPTTVPQSA